MKAPQSKSSQRPVKAPSYGGSSNDEGGKFVDRDLKALNDGGESLAPTDAEPVSLHKRMAGAC